MPPEAFNNGLSTSEWLTIVNIIVGVLVALGVQSFAFWRWLTKQFEARDLARETEISDRNKALEDVKATLSGYADEHRKEIARVDKDISQLRENVNVKLATLPTQKEMEQMLANRVGPIEQEMRALTIELARNGLHNPNRQQ